MKNKYKSKKKKNNNSKPISILTTDLTFDMFDHLRIKNSIKFKEINSEEVKAILKGKSFKVYIDEEEQDLYWAIRNELQIRFKKRHDFYISDNNKLIIIHHKLTSDNKIELKYFDCEVQSERHILYKPRYFFGYDFF